jgi:hypothetical protein
MIAMSSIAGVRGVRHRQQRALVGEGDGDRLIALGNRDADQVGGRHVHREHRQVEVLEAVALGQRTGQAVLGQLAVVQQLALGRRSRVARNLERVVDDLARGEAELDDHVVKAARSPRREGW